MLFNIATSPGIGWICKIDLCVDIPDTARRRESIRLSAFSGVQFFDSDFVVIVYNIWKLNKQEDNRYKETGFIPEHNYGTYVVPGFQFLKYRSVKINKATLSVLQRVMKGKGSEEREKNGRVEAWEGSGSRNLQGK